MAESEEDGIIEIGASAAAAAPKKEVRKLVHKENIEPMKVDVFDRCHVYLRGIVRKHYKEARKSFRALQIPRLFEEHSEALIEAVRDAMPNEKERAKVDYDSVKWFFTTPSAYVGDNNVTEALAKKLNELVTLSKQELNTEGVDEELQRIALDNPDCPAEVIDFAHERPSAFAVFVSDSKYRSEIVAFFRSMMSENERGQKQRSFTDMVNEVFPRVMKCGK